MKYIFFLPAFILSIGLAQAQDKTVKKLQAEAGKTIKKDNTDTAQKAWKKGGVYSINLSQGSLTNWAAGGDDFSLAISSYLNLFLFYNKGRRNWDNTLDLNFGYVNTTSLGSRKNDDRIDLLTKYGYSVAPKFSLTGLFNFRSQMLRGYTYQNDARTLSSTFLAPAYVLISGGMDFKPNKSLSVFLSPITSRWIIVKDDTLSAKGLYGVDTGRHTASEIGAFLTASFKKDFSKSLSYKARLDLFSNYKHNPQNVDLFFSNIFSAKITKLFSASWNVDVIYDDDVRLFGKNADSPAMQIKSMVGLGLLMKF